MQTLSKDTRDSLLSDIAAALGDETLRNTLHLSKVEETTAERLIAADLIVAYLESCGWSVVRRPAEAVGEAAR